VFGVADNGKTADTNNTLTIHHAVIRLIDIPYIHHGNAIISTIIAYTSLLLQSQVTDVTTLISHHFKQFNVQLNCNSNSTTRVQQQFSDT
jgi:hypothetical protein